MLKTVVFSWRICDVSDQQPDKKLSARTAPAIGCCALLFAMLAAAPKTAIAEAASASPSTIVVMDRASLQRHLKALGYRARGGVERSKSDGSDSQYRSLPHFSSSFSVHGVTYPYTMLGYAPPSGRTAQLRSVIVPLRMRFSGFGPNGDVAVDFDPKDAVKNIVNSPMYQEAQFPNGVGQFGDMMQRATFWNKMDREREWHVQMADPRSVPTIDIEVTPETGTLFQDTSGNFFGDVLIDFLDSQARTIIQLARIDPDELPIFVTQNVTAEALGYHNAFSVSNEDGSETLQTMIYTSWLDPRFVDPLFADVSTFNHEEGEWLNDPFVNNAVPDWVYPPPSDPRAVCSGNPFLEVGDPQGNGPTFDDFPTVVVTIKGVPYHLQQLVMLPWFADEKPSSAENGWYTFPAPASLTVPAVYCQ
jgi:hypothetical protein